MLPQKSSENKYSFWKFLQATRVALQSYIWSIILYYSICLLWQQIRKLIKSHPHQIK